LIDVCVIYAQFFWNETMA